MFTGTARFGLEYRPLRILDFDIENRPLHYWYEDKTTAEITAIAWAFYDDTSRGGRADVEVRVLRSPPYHEITTLAMLRDFVGAYNEADMVTGHFIRAHDLPIINSALIERGLLTLPAKLTSDTKLDLLKRTSLSVSQKNLSHLLDVKAPKIDMPQANWRDANRLTEGGIEMTRARVVGDILQHMELRKALIIKRLLGPPRMWYPGGAPESAVYTP